jgi:hypothetical protein
MKSFFTCILLLAFFVNTVSAQIVQKGTSTVQIGYGFPSALQIMGSVFKFALTTEDAEATTEFKYKGLGPFHFRYDRMLGGRVGLGLSSNAEFGNFKFTATYADEDDNQVFSETKFNYSSINAMVRLNFHFIKNPQKVDIYYGLGAGYAHTRVKLEQKLGGNLIDPEEQQYVDEFNDYLNAAFSAFPIAMESVFGLKAPLSNTAGFYFEVGYAKALAQIGFYAKIGGPKGYNSDSWKWY